MSDLFVNEFNIVQQTTAFRRACQVGGVEDISEGYIGFKVWLGSQPRSADYCVQLQANINTFYSEQADLNARRAAAEGYSAYDIGLIGMLATGTIALFCLGIQQYMLRRHLGEPYQFFPETEGEDEDEFVDAAEHSDSSYESAEEGEEEAARARHRQVTGAQGVRAAR